jgi:hypothetical protein
MNFFYAEIEISLDIGSGKIASQILQYSSSTVVSCKVYLRDPQPDVGITALF